MLSLMLNLLITLSMLPVPEIDMIIIDKNSSGDEIANVRVNDDIVHT